MPMPVSASKRKAARQNAKRSTGPRTTAGKQAVRYNAVKHGASAKTPVLPWESPEHFQELLRGYETSIQPVGDVENDLVHQLALASWQRRRGISSDVARVTHNIHTARAEELRLAEIEAAALCQRLFFECHGPLPLYPRPESVQSGPRLVWSKIPEDGDHPSRLVMAMERTWAGCRLLLARWRELRDRLEAGECWHAPERLKAVRMLGKLPYDAADDRELSQIYLCCHVIEPNDRDDPFFDISYDMQPVDYKRFRERLARRNVESMRPTDAAAARALLLALVDRKIDRLDGLATDRLVFDDAMNALKTDIMGFDDSIEGERLRRHMATCERAMHRTIATIIKMRKDLETPEFDPIEDESAESGDGHPARQPVWAVENEPPSDATNPDLQNKATAAGDEPQDPAAPHVQDQEDVDYNNVDFGPEDRPTAAVLEQSCPTETTAKADREELRNGHTQGDGHLARQPERVEHEDSGPVKQVRAVNQESPTAQAIRTPNTDHRTRETVDLQIKATVDGDYPQVPTADDVQETRIPKSSRMMGPGATKYQGPVVVSTLELGGRTIRLVRPTDPDRLLDDPLVLEWNRHDDYMPYWAYLWPGAYLLAEAVAREPLPEPVEGEIALEALEIGCGLGLAGLVALARGLRVQFTDYDQAPLDFVARSTAANRFDPTRYVIRSLDWRDLPDDRFFLILGADVIYEAPLVPLVANLLRKLLAPGGVALIASPYRLAAEGFPAATVSLGLECQAEPATARTEDGRSIQGTIYRIKG